MNGANEDRAELADLAFQVRAWAELDSLMGLGPTVVPFLEPFAAPSLAHSSAAAPATLTGSRGAPGATPANPTSTGNVSSFAARAAAAMTAAQGARGAPAAPQARAAARAATTAPAFPTTPAEPISEAERAARAEKLTAIHDRLKGCQKCALAAGRTQVVPGQGDPMAELVFVGEGPGETEDRTGLAFVGKAGELLTKMIGAMGLARDRVFIANVVKCRPPGNRPPTPDEMATCLPYLEEQLQIVKPRVICALGKTAAVGLGLVRPTDALGPARGRFHGWRGTPVMVTYHPSYLLRTPGDKRKAWEDLQKIFPYLTRRDPTPTKE